MSWKVPNEKWLLETLVDLILDESISKYEREIYVYSKNDLGRNHNDRSIAIYLKQKLSLLAVQQKLTQKSVEFLNELSQHYIGNGSGGRDFLFGIWLMLRLIANVLFI